MCDDYILFNPELNTVSKHVICINVIEKEQMEKILWCSSLPPVYKTFSIPKRKHWRLLSRLSDTEIGKIVVYSKVADLSVGSNPCVPLVDVRKADSKVQRLLKAFKSYVEWLSTMTQTGASLLKILEPKGSKKITNAKDQNETDKRQKMEMAQDKQCEKALEKALEKLVEVGDAVGCGLVELENKKITKNCLAEQAYDVESTPFAFGRYGRVFRVKQKDVPHLALVIKTLNSCHSFCNEIKAYNVLKLTSFVPRLYDAWICNQSEKGLMRYVLVLERLDQTLLAYLRERAFKMHDRLLSMADFKEETQRILRQLLTIFATLDSLHVFHADLHMQNIMVKDGEIKILDFGNSSTKVSHAQNMQSYKELYSIILNCYPKLSRDEVQRLSTTADLYYACLNE